MYICMYPVLVFFLQPQKKKYTHLPMGKVVLHVIDSKVMVTSAIPAFCALPRFDCKPIQSGNRPLDWTIFLL